MDDRKPVKVYSAKDKIEADMLIELLDQNGIPAYRKGVAGGDLMDIYAGSSIYGEEIYVNESEVTKANEIIETIISEDPIEEGEVVEDTENDVGFGDMLYEDKERREDSKDFEDAEEIETKGPGKTIVVVVAAIIVLVFGVLYFL